MPDLIIGFQIHIWSNVRTAEAHHSAIHLCDQHRRRVFKLESQWLPILSHCLAMPTPATHWSSEFRQHVVNRSVLSHEKNRNVLSSRHWHHGAKNLTNAFFPLFKISASKSDSFRDFTFADSIDRSNPRTNDAHIQTPAITDLNWSPGGKISLTTKLILQGRGRHGHRGASCRTWTWTQKAASHGAKDDCDEKKALALWHMNIWSGSVNPSRRAASDQVPHYRWGDSDGTVTRRRRLSHGNLNPWRRLRVTVRLEHRAPGRGVPSSELQVEQLPVSPARISGDRRIFA